MDDEGTFKIGEKIGDKSMAHGKHTSDQRVSNRHLGIDRVWKNGSTRRMIQEKDQCSGKWTHLDSR